MSGQHMTVAVGDLVQVNAPGVDPRQEFRVTEVREAKRANGRVVAEQFDAVGEARDKNGRPLDAVSRSFFTTDIRTDKKGGRMPTGSKAATAKKATAKKKATTAKTATKSTRGKNAARDAEIAKLSQAGKTKVEIAEKFGISPNAVHGVLWRAGRK